VASEAGMRESIPVVTQPITKFTQSEIQEQLIPGVHSLGLGYRVLSAKYADSNGLTQSLFNLGKMEKENIFGKIYNRPKHVSYIPIEKSVFKIIAGLSIYEYQNELAVMAGIEGKYGGFKGSLETNFKSSKERKFESSFATVYGLIQKWRLQIDFSRIRDLSSMLKKKVRKDLNDSKFDAEELFTTYGTHFLTGIIVGARVNYSNSVDKKTIKNKDELGVVAKLSYAELFKGETVFEKKEEVKKFNETKDSYVVAIGGNSSLSEMITEGKYDEWVKSTDERPVFIDFAENSLHPIWELCESLDRKKSLQEAYEKLEEKSKSTDIWGEGYSGGSGGIEFKDYEIPENSTVIEVRIRSGVYIDAIGIVHETADGKRHASTMHGGEGGNLEVFTLDKNDYINGISGRYGTFVDSIRFHTNRKISPTYGGSGGKAEYHYEAPEGTEVVGFYGRSGQLLDAIGIVLTRR